MYFRQSTVALSIILIAIAPSHSSAVSVDEAARIVETAIRIDPIVSKVYARVEAVRVGHTHGVQGAIKSGTIDFSSGGKIIFDMRSFAADAPDARKHVNLSGKVSSSDQRKTTENMLSKYVLDAERFPEAIFEITSIRPQSGQRTGQSGYYQFSGNFTLHGSTRPVAFAVNIDRRPQTQTVHMTGTFSILQSDFGIKPYSALGGLAKVADRVQIWGDLAAQFEATSR